MKGYVCLILGSLSCLVVGCGKKDDSSIVSQKYVHKYGYAVSRDEFENRKYPGQVVTVLKNGTTVTSTYEEGVLHGPSTQTYPNSQTVSSYYLYNQGNLVKEISYDVTGMPLTEEVQLSPTRRSITLWYNNGTPRSVEEYIEEELLEGQYFTTNNNLESQVIKGEGKRVRRDPSGSLLSSDEIKGGFLTRRESFYSNGFPQTVESYSKGRLHGEKQTFNSKGEPLSAINYVNGVENGLTTLFKNGIKEVEVYYINGMKNGTERHFIDGNQIAVELFWNDNKLHGPATYYTDELARVDYYYDGAPISKSRWEEFNTLDEMIANMSQME